MQFFNNVLEESVMEFNLEGLPHQCRKELVAALSNVLERMRPYGECDANGLSHLLLVMIPAVEEAIVNTIVDYDDDLFCEWATKCRHVKPRPARNAKLFGQAFDGQEIEEAWIAPTKRIALQMAEYFRPFALSSFASKLAPPSLRSATESNCHGT